MLRQDSHQSLVETLTIFVTLHAIEGAARQLLVHLAFERVVTGIRFPLQDAANVTPCQLVSYIELRCPPGNGTLYNLFARNVWSLIAQIAQHFVISREKVTVAVAFEIQFHKLSVFHVIHLFRMFRQGKDNIQNGIFTCNNG